MRPYIVRQGDYLDKIAFMEGFDPDKTWMHEKNADLRKSRNDPSVLAPGDVLRIPERGMEGASVSLTQANSYRADVPRVDVGVRFLDHEGQPISNEQCVIALSGTKISDEKSDADGYVRFSVPAVCSSATITFERLGTAFRVLVGHLDPAETSNGEFQRLKNMARIPDGAEEMFRDFIGPGPDDAEIHAQLACNAAEVNEEMPAEIRKIHGR